MILNWANRVTVARILCLVPFVSCMLKINDPDLTDAARDMMRYVSFLIFMLIAASDMLDGYIARRNGQTTKLGAFLDPMADKLLMTCALLLLASQKAHVAGFQVPSTVVVLIIGKDMFLLMGFMVIYFMTFQVRIVPVLIGKIATALQLAMVAGILLGPELSQVLPGWIWVLRVLWWSSAATAVIATLIYTCNGSRYVEDYERKIESEKQIKKVNNAV